MRVGQKLDEGRPELDDRACRVFRWDPEALCDARLETADAAVFRAMTRRCWPELYLKRQREAMPPMAAHLQLPLVDLDWAFTRPCFCLSWAALERCSPLPSPPTPDNCSGRSA
jgi:hypothetical protein